MHDYCGLVGMVSTSWDVFARDLFKLFDKMRENAFKQGPDYCGLVGMVSTCWGKWRRKGDLLPLDKHQVLQRARGAMGRL